MYFSGISISVLLVRIHVGCLHVGCVSVLAGLVSLSFELLRSRQAYSFLEVNQRRLRRNTWECKYDTREKNLSAVLANSSNHCRARRHNK